MALVSEHGPDPFGPVMGGKRGTGQVNLTSTAAPDTKGMSLQDWAASLDEELVPSKKTQLHVSMFDCDGTQIDAETFGCDGKSLDELRKLVGDYIFMMASSGIHVTVTVEVDNYDEA